MAKCRIGQKPPKRYSSLRNSRSGKEQRVGWPTGPIKMFLPRCVRLRAVSLCVVLVFHLVSPAVRAKKRAPAAPVFVDVTQADSITFNLTSGSVTQLYIIVYMPRAV